MFSVRYFCTKTTDGETIVISKGDHYWHTLCMLRIMYEEYDDRKIMEGILVVVLISKGDPGCQ